MYYSNLSNDVNCCYIIDLGSPQGTFESENLCQVDNFVITAWLVPSYFFSLLLLLLAKFFVLLSEEVPIAWNRD